MIGDVPSAAWIRDGLRILCVIETLFVFILGTKAILVCWHEIKKNGEARYAKIILGVSITYIMDAFSNLMWIIDRARQGKPFLWYGAPFILLSHGFAIWIFLMVRERKAAHELGLQSGSMPTLTRSKIAGSNRPNERRPISRERRVER